MENTNTELQKIFNFVPPEIRLVSLISMTMKPEAFIEYTKNMNLMTIQQSNIDEDDRIFTYLPLALMYKNEEMMNFIHQILDTSGYKISPDEFYEQVKKINTNVLTSGNNMQLGGGKITDYLYAIGMIIFAIFYDYYIITNGSWDRLNTSITKIQDLSSKIQRGCNMEYRPSKTMSLLARGSKEPSFIYNLEHTMQCLSTPTLVSSKLHDLDVENESNRLIIEMQEKLKELPGFPELPEPTKIGTELVLFGQNPEDIEEHLKGRLLVYVPDSSDEINLVETKKQFKLLSDMSSEEFKKVIGFLQTEQTMPAPSPLPTQAPTWSHTMSFASDFVGALKEVAPTKFSPSFSFENVFLWALQDTIRETMRKIEDGKIKSKRDIENLITEATRVFSDISNLPYIMSFLFFLNLAAIRALIFFAKKMMGSKPKLLEIENNDNDNINEITNQFAQLTAHGGRRRKINTIRKHKRKTHRHKLKTHRHKRGGKRCQTRRKKARRITKKR